MQLGSRKRGMLQRHADSGNALWLTIEAWGEAPPKSLACHPLRTLLDDAENADKGNIGKSQEIVSVRGER